MSGVGWLALVVAALAVSLNPVSIAASLRMAAAERGTTLGLVFAAGWIAGLALTTYVLLLVINGFVSSPSHKAWVLTHLLIALVMCLLALRLWLSARHGRRPAPAWLGEVEAFTVLRALGVGTAMPPSSPRVLVFAVAGMVAMVQDTGSGVGLLVFVVIGSLGVLLPLMVVGLGRAGSAAWWMRWHVPIVVTGLLVAAATQLLAALLTP